MVLWPYARSTTGKGEPPVALVAGLLLILLGVTSGEGTELSRTSDTLHALGPGPYQLKRRFIIEDSDSVLVEGVLLTRWEDYRINYRLGLLTLSETPPDSVSLVIKYTFFPFEIEERYFRRQVSTDAAGKGVITERKTVEKKEALSAPSTLIIGGSKSLGVSVGSDKDLALEQALRVNISGMAAEGVEVRAVLSDQSTPIQPEGTTEELEELDQVVLEIIGRNLRASFGDYDLDMAGSEFGRVERRLEGGMGEARFADANVMLAAARNRGNFAFNRLWGIEGKQGPYQLTSDDGRTDIVVVAGSEKVYVDGELKKRGENNDYVIDYSMAQITFTSKVLIISRSRIVVDFEYSVLDYRRSLYAGSASYTSLARKLQVGGSFVYEGDDKGSPLGLDITPERRRLLQEAGDDSSLAWAPGGVFVGDSLGSYVWDDSIYVYVGYGKGDYLVSFTRVGENTGDYEYDYGLGAYRYVGQAQGEYVARVRLPLPTRDEFYTVSAQYNIAPATAARVEYAGSRRDENSFSPIGDGDNVGLAYRLSFKAELGKRFFLKSGYTNWDDQFSFPGRRSKPDYEDSWNVDEDEGEESVGEVEAGLSPFDALKLTGHYGRLKRPYGEADRTRFGVFFEQKNLPSISYQYGRTENDLDTNDTRTRHEVTAVQRVGWFSPRLSFFAEESRDRLREGTGGISFASSWLTGDVSYGHRVDDIKDTTGWSREATIRTARASFQAAGLRRLGGSFDFVHRDRRYARGLPGEDLDYDLASLRLKARPVEKRMSIEARYELTQTQIRAKRVSFYEVEEGSGDYSKDPVTGEYYADPEGNYRRQLVPTGDYRPVTEVSSSLRLYLLPVDVLSLDCFASIQEKRVREQRLSAYTFGLGDFHDDSTTISGSVSFQGDVNLFPHADRSVGMRLRYGDQEDNQLESIHAEREKLELSLLGKARLTRTGSGEAEVAWGNEERRSTERGLEKREVWKKVWSTLSFRPNARLEPSVSAGYERREVSEPYHYPGLGIIPVLTSELSPRLRYYLTRRGRAEINLTLTERRSDVDQLPADIQSLYPLGLTTTVRSSVEYRVNEWLTSFLNHTVRKKPEENTDHTLRVEMRASF